MKISIKKIITNKFIRDFIINTAASAIPVVLLQFLLEPLMSRQMDDGTFGLMIAVVSLFTMLSSVFGNTLNNVILLKHKEIDNELKDYNFIFIIFQIVNLIILMLVLILVYNIYDYRVLLSIAFVGISSTFFQYVSAQFRMDFKYHFYLFCELGKCAGYVIGFFVFKSTGDWTCLFLFGSIFESVICLLTTKIWKNSYKTSKYLKEISIATFFILGSSLTVQLVNYFDKLILYPVMGGDSVSIYNASTIIAKGLSLITTPMGAVLLGYLVKKNFMSIKHLWLIFIGFLLLFAPLFLVFFFASKFVLPYMYPNYNDGAQKLIILTTPFAIINIYISLCEPILLTHNGEKISLVYGIGKAILSIAFGFVGIWVNGLYGFCLFRLISTIIIFISVFILLLIRSKKIYSGLRENNDSTENDEDINKSCDDIDNIEVEI